MLRQVYEIADEQRLTMMNVFHAGDGNLHPLIVFDAREPGVWERVHRAGDEILAACVAAGGVLSGEHGIGLEKREAMPLVFTADDLDAQARLRDAFDPSGRANPQQGAAVRGAAAASCSASPTGPGSRCPCSPTSSSCATRSRSAAAGRGAGRGPHAPGGRRAAAGTTSRSVRAPTGIVTYDPADLTVTVRPAPRAASWRRCSGPTGRSARSIHATTTSTIGGLLATGLSGAPAAAVRTVAVIVCPRCGSSPPTAASSRAVARR